MTVIRKGKSLETEYSVQPSPHKELAAEIKAAFEAKTINLDALFDGANPFEEGAEEEESMARRNRPEVV